MQPWGTVGHVDYMCWGPGMFTPWIILKQTPKETLTKSNHFQNLKNQSLMIVSTIIHRIYENMLLRKSVQFWVPVLGKKEADILPEMTVCFCKWMKNRSLQSIEECKVQGEGAHLFNKYSTLPTKCWTQSIQMERWLNHLGTLSWT